MVIEKPIACLLYTSFAGVLLHVIKAPRPVDLPGDGANLHRTVGGVENDVVFLVDIQHPGRTQNAMILSLIHI